MDNPECFVIMPISEIDDYPDSHFKDVYEKLIQPACKLANVSALRADNIQKSDIIIMSIIGKLLTCSIAICDMSSNNPNVFYELGIRHARNLKTILIKDERTKLPFDVESIRYFEYNSSLQIDTIHKNIEGLAAFIKNTIESDDIPSMLYVFDSIKQYKSSLHINTSRGDTGSFEQQFI